MDPTYWKVLNGQLASPPPPKPPAKPLLLTIEGSLTEEINILWVDPQGNWRLISYIANGQLSGGGALTVYDGQILVFVDSVSGAFISALKVDPTKLHYTLDATVLTRPNDIGPPPEADLVSGVLIPPDSVRVAVGFGQIAVPGGDRDILRYQYWRRGPASYALAAHENRTVVTSQTVGRVESSSDIETVRSALNLSTTVGWGFISSTVSASLSTSSTTAHSLTISESDSRFVTDNLSNRTLNDVYVLHWQLIDSICIQSEPAAIVETVLAPMIPRTVVLSGGSKERMAE
jgi:hypothetical protein